MVTKHFLLSLWNGLEGVKGTPRITRKTSSSFPSRKGTGQMKEVGDNGLRYVKPCFGLFPGPILQRSQCRDWRGLEESLQATGCVKEGHRAAH